MTSITQDWQKEFDKKIDRLLNDVEFIKNRTSIYLGRNESLTYLADETPVFVNTDDFGCPINFLNGGRYEEEYFSVLLSFRKPGAQFLDVGANLGVYSLRLAPYLRTGRIHSFEPLSRIRNLLSRSVFLNGYGGNVSVHPYALSDTDGEAVISIPEEHTGGASLGGGGANGETVGLRRLDDYLPGDFVCHMVKLDVEGHELRALQGMRNIMRRSPDCIVMFEKLAIDSGIEAGIAEYAKDMGWEIYSIQGVNLLKVGLDAFRGAGGYFIAGRPEAVENGGCERNFFDIYPADLAVLHGKMRDQLLQVSAPSQGNTALFHGPYWFLPKGYYRISIDGAVTGRFQLDITERFGYKVAELELRAGKTSFDLPIYRDLCKFEVVLRSVDSNSTIEMRKLRLTRLG